MIILGIDPGTTRIGYAVVNALKEKVLLDYGLISIKSKGSAERLLELGKQLKKVIHKWKPEVLSIEKIFFFKNSRTAMSVAEARGVILLTAALYGLKVYEYTPLEVKLRITGFGRADKKQVGKMIKLITKLDNEVKSDDVTDAIAVALATDLVRDQH